MVPVQQNVSAAPVAALCLLDQFVGLCAVYQPQKFHDHWFSSTGAFVYDRRGPGYGKPEPWQRRTVCYNRIAVVKDLIVHWATLGRPIIVFDLETTAWEGSLAANWSGPGEYREVVQIGAVRLAPDLSEVSNFLRYIRPVRSPVLSSYFTDLTGVTQQMINARGTDFSTALHDFVDFVGAASAIVSNSTDGDVIVENCRLHGFPCRLNTTLFRDIRKDIARALSMGDHETPSYMLSQLVGGPNPGRAHDGLSDARCIAAALRFIAARA